MSKRVLLLFCAALTFAVPSQARTIVALLSDYGRDDGRIGQAHARLLAADPTIEVIDLGHQLPEDDRLEWAALVLRNARRLPPNTIVIACVDEAAAAQAPIVFRSQRGFYFLGPDNGVLSWALEDQGIFRAMRIEASKVNLSYHAGDSVLLDLLCPAAAQLVKAGGDLTTIGSALDPAAPVRLATPSATVAPATHEIVGQVLHASVDRGEVWTNVTREDLDLAGIRVGDDFSLALGAEGSGAGARTLTLARGDLANAPAVCLPALGVLILRGEAGHPPLAAGATFELSLQKP